MKNLILVRHGQSEWNLKNLFTGWTDVDLTAQGVEEAYKAGIAIKEEGIRPPLNSIPGLGEVAAEGIYIPCIMNLD